MALFTAVAGLAGAAVVASACGGGTSSGDKTKTASAGSASSPAATAAATKAATAAATSGATGTANGTAAATGGTTVMIASGGSLGQILTDTNGMTLYTFKNDVANSGKSAAESLAGAWPPLTASGTPTKPTGLSGDLAVITRNDGKTQVTYKGLPLYFFVNDKKPGDTNGQNVGGVWFVAQP